MPSGEMLNEVVRMLASCNGDCRSMVYEAEAAPEIRFVHARDARFGLEYRFDAYEGSTPIKLGTLIGNAVERFQEDHRRANDAQHQQARRHIAGWVK